MEASDILDAVIIGGGFYGCTIAAYLAKQRGLKRILLIERESSLLTRASYNNQARIHNGYHYPRSFTTAYRSRVNLPRFVRDWPEAVKRDFTNIYAIARRNSKVTARQFERFCRDIGASIRPADPDLRTLFEPKLIEGVFLVEEYAFDTTMLARWAEHELASCDVKLQLNSCVTAVYKSKDGALSVSIKDESGNEESIACNYVFNCAYSGINQLKGDFPCTKTILKQEITEMALIQTPTVLKDLSVTVMDGPFFSIMPFPARQLHTLSHVRYTPHLHWLDKQGFDPYKKLDEYDHTSRFNRMIRDVRRYLPAAFDTKYIESLFEVKSVLVKNESDDGRPILYEKHPELPGCYSILGGKIDNIYDVLEKLDNEIFIT